MHMAQKNLYVRRVKNLKDIVDDAYTPKQIAATDWLAARAKKGKGISAVFSSADELITDLRS